MRTLPKPFVYPAQLLILFVAYVATARLGLELDAVSGFAALIWAPSGLSIACLILFGRRLWPAVFLGAFVSNFLTGAPPLVAGAIGAGNALEAIAASWLLLKDGRFRHTLDDPRSVLSFIGLAAGVSTVVSATIGVASLRLGGVIAGYAVAETWLSWWVGDIFGAIIIAPLLLVWIGRGASWTSLRPRLPEAAGILVAMAAILAVASSRFGESVGSTVFNYLLILPIVWAGVRFGMRGATATLFAFAASSVFLIVQGRGPFAIGSLNEGFTSLHLFIGTSSLLALFLGSAHDERLHADRERNAMRDELTEQAAYLKSIIGLAPIGIKLLDREGRILQINPAGLTMLEAESEGQLTKSTMLAMVEENDRSEFAALLARVFGGGEGSLHHTVVGLKGGRCVLDVRMVPFRGENGKIVAALGIFHDVTLEVEQKRSLEERGRELEQLNKTLVGRELKMIELKKDLKKAKGSDAAKGA